MSYLFASIGVPMLVISLILGIQWAYMKLPNMVWLDSKVLGSLLVLILYSIYLYLKVGRGMSGKSLATWNVAAFLVVLINFFLFGRLSSFHFWYE